MAGGKKREKFTGAKVYDSKCNNHERKHALLARGAAVPANLCIGGSMIRFGQDETSAESSVGSARGIERTYVFGSVLNAYLS